MWDEQHGSVCEMCDTLEIFSNMKHSQSLHALIGKLRSSNCLYTPTVEADRRPGPPDRPINQFAARSPTQRDTTYTRIGSQFGSIRLRRHWL
jgi:hypothetical protein